MLESEASCREYLTTQSIPTIARQIRRDQESCKSQRLPSILVRYLPPVGSDLADKIALELCPDTASFGRSITQAQYAGIVQGIKSYLEQMTHASRHEKLPTVQLGEYVPSGEEIKAALTVLDFCLKSDSVKGINLKSPLEDIFQALNVQLQDTHSPRKSEELLSVPQIQWRWKKKCYICKFVLVIPHPQYHSLCKQCGDFNLASSSISLPENLQLQGRTALVTGGRLNLGFHTALRLLRCGAKVIVSTRYPRDAERCYLAEKGFESWQSSLKIIGADFRAAADVFQLVMVVKQQLMKWGEDGVPKLDILVNNAAQTLTDPLKVEAQAVKMEHQLRVDAENATDNLLLASSTYQPRIRGGVQTSRLLAVETDQETLTEITTPLDLVVSSHRSDSTEDVTKASLVDYRGDEKSSWMQSIYQIPYEDVISAHSVNTFVPLILLRELLPLMGSLRPPSTDPRPPRTKKRGKPLGYIINVSSREGIFELSPDSSSKQGHHVHTNLTKAALNMLTETEAGPAWKTRRVAINSVDPGYMSAAPEIEEQWKMNGRRDGCPIGWEDGAGRVLWPIAVGERHEGLIWGRFLKHFGSTEVDVGVGR